MQEVCSENYSKRCYIELSQRSVEEREELCSENYSKRCYVELSQRAVQERVERCHYPRERLCDPPGPGQPTREVCQTQYETSCVTQSRDIPVVEDVMECQEECEEDTCEERCGMVQRTVVRALPDTVCQKIPFEACAPDNCYFVPGEPQCQNNTQDVTVDSPEEVCDLQPQRMCKQVYRLVPKGRLRSKII